MDLKKIIREEVDDFDWARSGSLIDIVLNKALHFDPIAEYGDKDYEFMTKTLVDLGFKPKYSTPIVLESEPVEGLYIYVDHHDGGLSFVYTTLDYGDEEYEEHITNFAKYESIDGGKDLILVDAREFISSLRF